MTPKLHPGSNFPATTVKSLEGADITLGQPAAGTDWQMVVVYRGRHCPMCTKYLNKLERFKQQLFDLKVDLVAVSGDSKSQVERHLEHLTISFPLYYGLSVAQMEQLGLFISVPRSEKETDHNFPEPAIFVINESGQVQVADLSNNPFARPELATLVSGLEWIRNPDNSYPIRGTHAYG